MSNLATKLRREPSYLETGVILAQEGRQWLVAVGATRLEAERAAMCLVEPAAGDEVLVAHVEGRSFVLGVLVRSAANPNARVALDGDLELALPRGALRVTAQRGCEVTSAGPTTLVTPRVSVCAAEGEALVDKLRVLGKLAHVDVDRVALVADKIETACTRLWQRVKRSYRFVAEFDQLRAEHIDHRARQTARVHAENAVVTASVLAKIDGEQVHIG